MNEMNVRQVSFFIRISLALLSVFLQINIAEGQYKNQFENDLYQIAVLKNGDIELTPKNTSSGRRFSSSFMIMYRKDDPGLRLMRAKGLAFVVPAWKSFNGKKDTTDFFNIADTVTIRAARWEMDGNQLKWIFPSNKNFTLTASLSLPSGKEAPVVDFTLETKRPGWYSVGYVGAPQINPGQADAIWQPLIWQGKRFPYMPFLSMEFMCTIPGTLVNDEGYTIGVMADTSEIPFRFPTKGNSRFGVLVRNAKGNAQPAIFAPVLGQAASKLETGSQVNFQFRLIDHKADLFETYKYIAQHLLGFHDYRKNATCSLNETIENMIAYAMNDFYSGWNAELKAPDYATDVPGTVKLVSALHPLSIAMITDNKQVYTRRALPMIEYLMSREKYLFAIDTSARGQSPSHYLKGPAAEVSELAALYNMSGKESPVFSSYAQNMYGKPRVLNLKMISKGESWQSALALYRMNGDTMYLNKAKKGANEYIARRINTLQTDFSDVHVKNGGQFWTDFAPKWIDLLELYETTKDKSYLEAATKGAQLFVQYVWMEPAPPDHEIVINKGGGVGMYAYQNRHYPHAQPMKAPEQKVSAWRVAQTGLISEASTTYVANRAVFLAHYAAYLLRLSYYTGEKFFRDIARSAIVGRYANFPGYSIMGEYTTIYSRPDYPLHSLKEITYNNIYYNHIWPQITLLMDFLLSDAFVISKGNINFPEHYAQGYAYLQSKVYGDKKGIFYGDKNVQLWMPAKMLHTNNIQANYIAGYGNGNLYIALMNQSADSINIKVRLNPDIIPFNKHQTYKVRLWQDKGAEETTTMQNGEITVSLTGHGITAFSIDKLAISPQFQDKILKTSAPLPAQSYSIDHTSLGKVTGMIIKMGSMINGYIWLQATEKELQEARLYYKEDGKWKMFSDKKYPYEFSIPLSDNEQAFEYRVEGIDVKGKLLNSKAIKLELK